MKKSLFALAAVTAFAGAAQAQSSVTVYGILDVGYTGTNTRGGTTALATSSQESGFTATGNQSTSRIGFRGVEDLGGGTSAFFTLETGIAAMGTTAAPGATPTTFATTRLGFAGLSQKGVGQFALGTQNTPVHNAVGRTDPGQTNNISGNVIYTATTGAGTGETTNAYTVRVPNALTLQTERFSGFQINALYNANNQNTGSGTKNDNVAYGGGINFVMQKLNVDVAYQNLKNTTLTAGGVNAAASFDPGQTTVIFGTSVNQTQMYAGAVYDFGILKAYAQYINSKVVSNLDANVDVQRSAQQLGVRGNVTPKIEGWASIGNGRLTAGALQQLATTEASQNFTGYQVGANYLLSKRTNLYGIYGSTQVSSSSISASEGRNMYGVGVRHTF
jgi:predicted porin